MKKSFCLSHAADVDGVVSAAIVKMATGCDVALVGYGNLLRRLSEVSDKDRVFICDIGLSLNTQSEFLRQVSRIQEFAQVVYIDHHPMKAPIKREIQNIGVKLRHSTQECSGILTYLEFQDCIPKSANILAAYGAVTDYRDGRPIAERIIGQYDRQFILLESTLLAYSIARMGDDQRFLLKLVELLSHLKQPHQIDGVMEYAMEQAETMTTLMPKVESEGKKMKNFAYIRTDTLAAGNVANLLIGALDVPVGVAYRPNSGKNVFEVSLRGSAGCHKNLGSIVSSLASKLGGFGGGHSKAAGARIPESEFAEFIRLLDEKLETK